MKKLFIAALFMATQAFGWETLGTGHIVQRANDSNKLSLVASQRGIYFIETWADNNCNGRIVNANGEYIRLNSKRYNIICILVPTNKGIDYLKDILKSGKVLQVDDYTFDTKGFKQGLEKLERIKKAF